MESYMRLHARRTVLGLLAAAGALPFAARRASAAEAAIVVHRDPSCGCCLGWVSHLEQSGFTARVVDTTTLNAVKQRLGVPAELAACHTAEIGGYVLEGHVPAEAIRKILAERPAATGLSVPGMPAGSPGMEVGRYDRYDVVLFGPDVKRVYMSFVGLVAQG
jgi:hypothetical protein